MRAREQTPAPTDLAARLLRLAGEVPAVEAPPPPESKPEPGSEVPASSEASDHALLAALQGDPVMLCDLAERLKKGICFIEARLHALQRQGVVETVAGGDGVWRWRVAGDAQGIQVKHGQGTRSG